MMKPGRIRKLKIARIVRQGAYLCEEGEKDKTGDEVLLPGKQVPKGAKPGDEIEVFIYLDSSDRLIATTTRPLITEGEVARLKIRETTKIGAFLDIGLERDLLLPFSEQTYRAEEGSYVLAAMYVDKSGRLAATMKVYDYLSKDPPYRENDEVQGVVYEISKNFGAFVAVDEKYSGLIPAKEYNWEVKAGDLVSARVTRVLPDGKLDLSIRKKAYLQINDDAEKIFSYMTLNNGRIPFTDKADPELIKKTFHMSKAAFKRAVGHLLKDGRIRITESSIELS